MRLVSIMLLVWAAVGLLWWSRCKDPGVVNGAFFFGWLVLGLVLFTGERAWLVYGMTVVCAACRHRALPFWLVPFFDDAHRLGLLGAAGLVYQFRHAEFQDCLAAHRPRPALAPGPLPNWWRRNWIMVAAVVCGLGVREIWDLFGACATVGVFGPIALVTAVVQLLRRRRAGRP